MVGIELVHAVQIAPATAETEAVRDHCCQQGVLVGVGGVYGNVVRVQPPLVITCEQIDRAINTLAKAFEQLQSPPKQVAMAR